MEDPTHTYHHWIRSAYTAVIGDIVPYVTNTDRITRMEDDFMSSWSKGKLPIRAAFEI